MKGLVVKRLFSFVLFLVGNILYWIVFISRAQAAFCGDGNCTGTENIFNCKKDCLSANVPTKPIPDVLNDAAKWLLGFAIMASLAVLIWGGIYYVGSSGDEQKTQTAKKLVKYSLMGILVVGISYAVIVALDKIFH